MDHGVDDELICFEKGVLYKVRVLAKRVRKRKSEANDKRRLWYKVRFDGRNTRFDQWVLPHFLRPVAGFPVRRFFPKAGYFDGKVQRVVRAGTEVLPGEGDLYLVRYSDGDTEEINLVGLNKYAVELPGSRRKPPPTRAATRGGCRWR